MALTGMDIDAVNQLAADLRNQAESIDQVIAAVNNLITHSQEIWKGNDSTTFASWWDSQHRPALIHVRDEVNGLAQSATANAQAQAEVSGQA